MDTLYGQQLAEGELQDAINILTGRMEQLDFMTDLKLLEAYRAVLDDLMSLQEPVADQEL